MAKKLKQVRSAEKSRQELLTAGKKVFAQQGFAGANTRDIAREAGVNISLISYYYGGKEGLYRACLKDFGESRVTALDRLLTPPKNREDFRVRVELAVDEMVEFHLADADILAILVRDLH
ncbi:MAG: TetR/AcrR family transcriptional regulator, partial [Bdellovibrionota bacterium]